MTVIVKDKDGQKCLGENCKKCSYDETTRKCAKYDFEEVLNYKNGQYIILIPLNFEIKDVIEVMKTVYDNERGVYEFNCPLGYTGQRGQTKCKIEKINCSFRFINPEVGDPHPIGGGGCMFYEAEFPHVEFSDKDQHFFSKIYRMRRRSKKMEDFQRMALELEEFKFENEN